MPILVDVNGDGLFDKDDDPVTILPPITDETADGKPDVNLTSANSVANIDGAIFQDAANVGAGTGSYNTFLALQDKNDSDPANTPDVEIGFNTGYLQGPDPNPEDTSNTEMDASKSEAILLGAIPIIIGTGVRSAANPNGNGGAVGVAYYEFRVDLNENNDDTSPLISLDQFKLFVGGFDIDPGAGVDLVDTFDELFDLTKVYDMDGMNGEHDISILFDEKASNGSGTDDYSVLVPISNFGNADPATTYVYLFAEMGIADGSPPDTWGASGGFHEWNLQNAVIIQGQKFNDLDGDGVKDAGEGGVAGVTIFIDDDLDGIAEATDNDGFLTGDTNGNGQLDPGETITERFDITDVNGFYSFGGIPLRANDYTIYIREVVPAGSVPTTTLPVAVLIDNNYAAGTIIDHLDGAGSDPYVPGLLIGNRPLTPNFSIDKQVISVVDGPDATAVAGVIDGAGDQINYRITIVNTGELALNLQSITDLLEGNGVTVNADSFTESGSNNNILDLGETWTWNWTETVSQTELNLLCATDEEITNTVTATFVTAGGVVVGPLGDTVNTPVICDPDFSAVKTIVSVVGGVELEGGDPNTTADDAVDSAGDKINYALVITNTGNVTLDGETITDTFEGAASNLTSADFTETGGTGTNGDGILDVGETWTHTFTEEVSQAELDAECADNETIINSLAASFVFDGETLGPDGNSVETPVICDPSMTIAKNVRTDTTNGAFVAADSPTGPTASSQSTVNFQVLITNTGNITLTAIALADYVHAYPSGTDTTIFYGTGSADPNDIEVDAQVDLDNDGTIDSSWDALDTNGDGTLSLAELPDGLAPGETMAIYYSLESKLGQHTNTVTVDTAETASQTNDANYYVFPNEDCVGVRTPGFWANTKWGLFWNFDPTKSATATDQDALPQVGQPGFASGELLYAVDTNEDGFVNVKAGDTINDDKPLDPGSGLLIGDYNMNGITDAGEDTIFISLSDAKALINASSKQLHEGGKTADGIYMLGRDVVATWLNYLANNEETIGECVGVVDVTDGTNTPREFINAAVDWLQQFASDANSTAANNLVNSYHDGNTQALFQFDGKQHPSSDPWQKAVTTGEDIPVSASEIHAQLDAYNNNGIIYGTEYCCDADSELAQAAQLQFA